MSFQILPNLIFLFSVLGIIVLILRRVPQATGVNSLAGTEDAEAKPEEGLRQRGVPAVALSKGRQIAVAGAKRAWKFVLEAKGLSHGPKVNYRISKLLKRSAPGDATVAEAPVTNQVQPDEQFYLDQIKRFPKAWENYDNLGQFYLDKKNFEDALGVYEFLTKQDQANDNYWARLGFVKICMKDNKGAAEAYEKSIGLDPSHPNRYYNLGLAYIETGENDKAKSALGKAIELEPENAKYAEAMGKIEE